MKDKLLLLNVLLAVACSLDAQIKLPGLISDNMVLQQRSNVKLWGTAESQSRVKISPEWTRETYVAEPDQNGNWEVIVPTSKAGGPYKITFTQKNSITVSNVMLGEVWLCSGQSNMEMPMEGFTSQPVNGSQEMIAGANPNTPIRLFTVPRAYKRVVTDSLNASWQQNTPAAVADFSATGYFFAQQLYKALQIPIGMIHSSWGGSRIEAWMPMASLRKEFSESEMKEELVGSSERIDRPHLKKSLLYNAMIYPLVNYQLKGVIWYQGESNTHDSEQYKRLSKSWIADWRNSFNRPDMPFYITQIAPFRSINSDSINWAIFRDAQIAVAQADSLTDIVFTMDIGNESCIHPADKKEVGERLGFCALARTYQKDGILYQGPVMKSWLKKDNRYIITMEHVGNGLNTGYQPLRGFEFISSDGKVVEAKARITGNGTTVEVWSDEKFNPKEIRYAYKNYPEGNLRNSANLPSAGFRIILMD